MSESAPSNPQKDCRAWERLVEAAGPESILVVIRHRIRGELLRRFEPEDVFQETLMRSWEAWPTFTYVDVPAFHRWLLQIAANVIADLVDREKAQKRGGGAPIRSLSEPTSSGTAGAAGSAFAGPLDSKTPSRFAMDREKVAAMEAALAALPEDTREVVRLRLFEGCLVEEVSQQLGLGVGAVRHRFTVGTQLYYSHLHPVLEAPKRKP